MLSRPSAAAADAEAGMPEAGGMYEILADKARSEVCNPAGERAGGGLIEQILVGSLALAALLLCSYNVFVRYFFPPLTLEMSDEVQVYLVIWSVFLALGLVTAADRHVKADLFLGMFRENARARLHLLSEILGLAFSLLLVGYGAAVTWETYTFGDLSITSLRFPLWIYAAALPAGALLMGVRYALRLANLLRNKT
jgi:C4-dicarboxylate transporter DctQ subunit